MVAIRSMGMSLESVIGMLDDNEEGICIVSEDYLQGLLAIANERFEENTIRIARFRNMLLAGNANLLKSEPKKNEKGEDWEDAAVRRERKRAEGLQRSEELKKQLSTGVQQTSYP
jgi:tRNA wybutosine-synthesizing protein 3